MNHSSLINAVLDKFYEDNDREIHMDLDAERILWGMAALTPPSEEYLARMERIRSTGRMNRHADLARREREAVLASLVKTIDSNVKAALPRVEEIFEFISTQVHVSMHNFIFSQMYVFIEALRAARVNTACAFTTLEVVVSSSYFGPSSEMYVRNDTYNATEEQLRAGDSETTKAVAREFAHKLQAPTRFQERAYCASIQNVALLLCAAVIRNTEYNSVIKISRNGH